MTPCTIKGECHRLSSPDKSKERIMASGEIHFC